LSIFQNHSGWDDHEGSHTAEPYVPSKKQQSSSQRVGTGSFACPQCDVPVTLGGPVVISGRMRCPFCRGIHPVRSFVRLDMLDTPLNAIELRARVPR